MQMDNREHRTPGGAAPHSSATAGATGSRGALGVLGHQRWVAHPMGSNTACVQVGRGIRARSEGK